MKFGQQLLSNFNMEWGLDSYVAYVQHKQVLKEVRDGSVPVQDFFSLLNRDLEKINLFVKQLETCLNDHINTLRTTPKSQLKKERIFDAFNEGKALHAYQLLNKTSFEKIVKKFQKVMGLRIVKKKAADEEDEEKPTQEPMSEVMKARLREQCDEYLQTVEESYFMNPERIDIASDLESLTALYAEGFSEGDEILATDVLEKVWSLDPRSQPRMVDYVDAHYYKQKMRKREMTYACKIVCGSTNRNLARNVSRCLGHKSLCATNVDTHVNGECNMQVIDNIRGDDVFVFQTVSFADGVSLGHAQMELLLLIHTCRLASAARITAVLPYTAYQSRKMPMGAFARMVTKMGADRVLTVDLLAGQIQGYFENVPLDNVKVVMEFVKYFREKLDMDVEDYANEVCIVAPRSTGVERAREFADELGCGLATVIRRRKEEMGEEGRDLNWQFQETTEVVGDVKDKICIVVSCILDEGENMVSVLEQIKAEGAGRCFAAAVHGVLAGEAVTRLNSSPVEEVVVTDTICQDALMHVCPKLRVIPVAPLLAECIDRIHSEASIGTMIKSHKKPYTSTRRISSYDSSDVLQQLEGVDLSLLRIRGSIDSTPSPQHQSRAHHILRKDRASPTERREREATLGLQ
eukprot:TRINITY_DN999_c0_g2_i1.p1 TRINITY_DN999_c0_g2~~TRINITY_DN999_c0_g2_i1.p1  ORF type:complete len:633 (+),score=294.69 TRINITY_DN999_c0_g2_i1:191-2089(+)